MKKTYLAPSLGFLFTTVDDELMLVVSGDEGTIGGDGTPIGDGGEGDGSVPPTSKERNDTFGNLW